MEVAKISATARQQTGKRVNARLRAEGRVPGVMYGLSNPNQSFSLDVLELQNHLRQHHRIYKVSLGREEHAAYLQDVQLDCITDEPMHVDFMRIDLNKPMDLRVEVSLVGHPIGLSKGGVLIRDNMEIEISALPTAIPENLPVKIDRLEIGDKLYAKELALPEGVSLRVSPDLLICHVVEARIEVAPEPAAAAAPAEGAAAAPEAAAKTDKPAAEKGDKAEKTDKAADKDKKK